MTISTDRTGQGVRGSSPASLSVSQLNRLVAQMLEEALTVQIVRGEISNLVRAASGHWYFSLKDAGAQVRAVMFRGRSQQVGFVPRDGMQVEVRAQVTLYQARGDFQLVVEAMRQAGTGDLYQQFLQLKEKLQREGLFDETRKRAVPSMPAAIGVVTSASGAALRDVLTTLARRAPVIPIYIFPSLVQGADAPAALIAAINAANAHGLCSVLLLVRGGGSIEDLWAFNDEQLARSIVSSAIPIVSGVGHETDFTIADFVADLRAPTPTGAATLVCPDRAELAQQLVRTIRALGQAWQRLVQRNEQQLDYAMRLLRPPSAQWRERRLQLRALALALQAGFRMKLAREQHRYDRASDGLSAPRLAQHRVYVTTVMQRFSVAGRTRLVGLNERLTQLEQRMHQASPQATLARGYAIVRQADGTVVHAASQVVIDEPLTVLLDKGQLDVRVGTLGLK